MATNDKRTDRERELDDFWDIQRLLPTRLARAAAVAVPKATPEGVELELAPPKNESSAQGRTVQDAPLSPPPARTDAAADQLGRAHYVPPHTADEQTATPPVLSYTPAGGLIHRVDVYAWSSDYRYFDQFIRDAEDFAARPAPQERPAKAPFFSFFPQYAQMSRAHRAWYLWWREQVRAGQYPDTDYAYILLYIFELINLPEPDEAGAREISRQLARLWMAYRARAPKLDHYMCSWLCDYCLIHRLPAPSDILSPALDTILQISRMKEFYLSTAIGDGEQGTDGARILLTYCCQYDYHKSKFASGEHAALFDRIIPGAVAHILPLLFGGEGRKPSVTMQDSIVTYEAYIGALCAYRHKRRLTVSYTSFSRSHDLRFLVGDTVKHIENRLRKYIGVRSRLSVMALPDPIRDALDAYLDSLLPEAKATPPPKKTPSRPAYEALYDLPAKPVSPEEAARIEAASWETTRILTEAFGGTDTPEEAPTAPKPQETTVPTESTETTETQGRETIPPELVAFLQLALAGDAVGQRELAERLHTLPDALADRINEWAVESDIGDVILEDTGAGYAVIEEYRADVTARCSEDTM